MKTFIKTSICALAAIVHVSAEDTTTTEAETTFRRTSAEAISPVTARYIVALSNLARKLDREGKSTDAKVVIAELERIRDATEAGKHPLETLPGRSNPTLNETTPSETAPAAAGSTGDLYLTPEQATLNGSLELHELTRILMGFKSEEDIATWSLEKFIPGTYDLILDYACPEDGQENAGGGSILVIAGNAKTTMIIDSQGTQTDFRKKVVGGIALTTSPVEISIGAVESNTPAGILQLRALILRPR